ncbi:MAG: hypothetical protein OEW84_07225 [Aigarchaeota archaeon]|nr:hypothetical protein [Aigarchaeota archaeon]
MRRRFVVIGLFLIAFGVYSINPIDPFVAPVTAMGVASLATAFIVLWWSTRPVSTPQPQAPALPEDLERTKETQLAVSEVKYCRYCGGENKPDAVYCESCGREIEEL